MADDETLEVAVHRALSQVVDDETVITGWTLVLTNVHGPDLDQHVIYLTMDGQTFTDSLGQAEYARLRATKTIDPQPGG